MDLLGIVEPGTPTAGPGTEGPGRGGRHGRRGIAVAPIHVQPRGDGPRVTAADVLGTDTPFLGGARRRAASGLGAAWRATLDAVAQPRPAGMVVAALGVLLMLLLAFAFEFTALSAQRDQHRLLQRISADETFSYSLASGRLPAQGQPVAVLVIPAIGLRQAVVEGTDATDLRAGPGHMPTTALPGQQGNAVIAGRRDTYGGPFGALGRLRPGDRITAVDGYGTAHYRVVRVEEVREGAHDVVTETAANRLTLVTADSAFLPNGRLAVIADLVGKPLPGAPPRPRFHPGRDQLGLTGDTTSALMALGWSLVFLVLSAGTAVLLRLWRHPTVVYPLAVPVLLVVALFACQSLAGALPATV